MKHPFYIKKMVKSPFLFSSLLGEEFFFRFWWVIAFFLFCHVSYDQAFQYWESEFLGLNQCLLALEKERGESLELQDELRRQINSQSDHAWIELTLMKGLGLVPEGQIKVFFDDIEG